ncbi:solute carrier family 25 member 33 [Coccidioides immitis H538.4]|uniref:Solute carrier family 25 member 33 n=1 Tax=Coccidioides immitis H538.4 TaxID=396776 RepID=A0A0J8RX36_COCIT|nr:solute carrier family 25 member 33 [Coccidioides immitis H538.4]
MSPSDTNLPEGVAGSSRKQQISHHPEPHSSVPQLHPNASPPPGSSPLTSIQIYSTRIPQAWVTPFCGASAGIASGIVTCPLDVIKTKLQAQGGFQLRRNGKLVETGTLYKGMLGTGSMIWKDEGVRGLYRGLGPMLLGYLPTWAIYLTIYDQSREKLVDGPWLCIPHGWSLLNGGHKPDLGH